MGEPGPNSSEDERDLTLPPHSVQAEEAVLGSILKHSPSIGPVSDFLRPEDFYQQRNRYVFRAMLTLQRDDKPIDYQTVADTLTQQGTYEAAGGLLYLTQINLATPTAAHVDHYGRIVERTSLMRQLIARAQTIAELAYRDNLDPEQALDKAQQMILSVAERYRGRAAATNGLPFITLCDLLEATPPEPTWSIPRLCAIGAVTDLVGKVKTAGKTTLLAAGARAAITGGRFLGHTAMRAPVVYLTEQPDTSLAEELVAAGLKDLNGHSDLLFIRRRDVVGLAWPDVVARAANLADRASARTVVIDTILAFAGLSAEQAENDAAAAQQAMSPVLNVVSQGHFGIAVSRHEGKGPERDIGEAGRGSSAWAGAADQLCVLRRPTGRQRPTLRQLDTLSRFQGLEPTAMIEWCGLDGYTYVGTDEQVQMDGARLVLCEFAPASDEDAVKLDQLIERCPEDRRPARTTAHRAAQQLVDDGDFRTRGKGVRGDPKVYWRGS